MRLLLLGAAPLAALLSAAAMADEPPRFQVSIKDHKFSPSTIRVPANRAFVIEVHNDDPTVEEFESADLGVEKVIAGGRQLPIRVRPLAPGKYSFMGEYHSDTATGTIIVEPAN